jgi:hypothetical protein
MKRLSSYVSMPSGKKKKIRVLKKVVIIMKKKLLEKCQGKYHFGVDLDPDPRIHAYD